jgi:hypothetical protein
LRYLGSLLMLSKLRPLFPDWLIGALCLLIPALYNGFPLSTSDSGGYISNAFTLYLPIDRPVGYSVLIRMASLGFTLWGVVLVQALVLSALLLTVARAVLREAYRRWPFMATMLLMGLATSAGWTTSQLTPDVFTPIMLLALCVLVFVSCNSIGRWLLYVVILGCMLVHNSNLLIGLTLAVLMALYSLWRKRIQIKMAALALICISTIAWLTLSGMNAIAGRGFRPSSATHVFIMSRMVENGIAAEYLKEHCATESSTLCPYRDQLPERQWGFMWDSSGPLYKAGGWQATEAEYTRIIRNTLMSPKYLGMHIVKNAEAAVQELALIYVGEEFSSFGINTSPYSAIERYYPQELKRHDNAREQQHELGLEYWNVLIIGFELLVCVAALLWSLRSSASPILRGMATFSILFILLNAAITVTFATVVARYEARVFWVLPCLATLSLISRYKRRREAQ